MKWSKEKIIKEARKYKTKTEFHKLSGGAYFVANKIGILNEICSHMGESKNSPWTFEELQQEALKYKTRGEFQNKNPNIYQVAYRKKILDKICGHMEYICYPWSIEELQEEALKYNNRTEFRKKSPAAYNTASQRKILNDICSHMTRLLREDWTLKELAIEALKYKTRWEFQQASLGAYKAAYKRNLLDEICKHMIIGTNSSVPEISLFDIVKMLYPKTQKLVDRKGKIENKPHIKGFDLDIYIPELRKGIEFDGKFHHSFEGLKRGRPNWPDEDLKIYHELKDNWFKSKNIKVIHVKEEDWIKNKQACIDKCLEFLNK